MRRITSPAALATFLVTTAVATGAAAQTTQTAQTAADSAKFIFDSRVRYEGVDQDGLDRASALTVRARLGWRSERRANLQFLIEGEAIGALVDDYNDTIHGPARYPVVADPETVELNRLQLSWTGLPDTEVILGRQRLVLDNARFVGNVGFRQNEQTFDAVTVRTRAFKPVEATYAYIDRVHRVFGDDSPVGEWRSDSHLLNLSVPTPIGKLTGYGYWLDFDNAPAQSSATVGVRLAGSRPVSPALTAHWTLEQARQSDHGRNPVRFDVDYTLISGGVSHGPFAATLAHERLGTDNGQAFQTPLATLHVFQGWADVFLTTPAAGLRDRSATAAWTVRQPPVGRSAVLSLSAREFHDADGDTGYGREFDASARLVVDARWAVEAKVARFDGARPAFADRTKVWVSLEHSF